MERERERAVRFSNLEIEVLVDLVKTHILVEGRRLDCSATDAKKKVWENITHEFWSRTSSNRTEFQLLKKWKNLKHAARKYEAAIKSKERSGRSPLRSPILEEVLEVIRKEQEVLHNSLVLLKSGTTINPTMCLPPKVKVEEEEEEEDDMDSYNNGINDNRMYSGETTHWMQEKFNRSSGGVTITNGYNLNPMEVEMTIQPQPFNANRLPACIPISLRSSNVVNHQDRPGDLSDDAISVGAHSRTSPKIPNPVSISVQPEVPTQTKASGELLNVNNLVQERDLGLRSAQLALLEKENKLKELDIRIKEEHLTDILIRRQQDQELHELRKRKMQQELSDVEKNST